jgi:mono/diheme cytochrome c family protein
MSQKSKKKNTQAGPAPRSKAAAPAGTPAVKTAPTVALSDDLEPQAEGAAMPVWLFVLLMVLIYWAMQHLDRRAGGFNKMVYGPYQSYKQLADYAPKSGPEMLIARGQSVYTTVCAPCHQPTGLGTPGQYPPLAGSEWAQGPANRVIRIPLHGLSGPIQVNGQEINASMPNIAVSLNLSDEDLAAILTYVRQAWGNKAPPITPAEVKSVRAETSSRTSPWTAEELLKIQ